MSFSILGLGTALPEHAMSQAEATELARQICCETEEQARLLKVLYRKAGVQNRYTVMPHREALRYLDFQYDHSNGGLAEQTTAVSTLGPSTRERMDFYEEHAFPLARSASVAALEQSGIEPRDITHLITVSCTGFVAPGVDVALLSNLGLKSTTQRVNVGFMGCHGAINGIRTGLAFTGSDPRARVLLCAVELCSLHYRFQWDPERFIGNALFADGSAALVGAGDKAPADAWKVVATGSCLVPDSTDAMSWRLGDHGFEMTLSSRVPDLIAEHLRPWLGDWLAHHGLTVDSVGSWAVHPGGPRIISSVEESLGLPGDATAISRQVLAECGNMSSPTVLFILQRLQALQAPRPCVALGFGPGLVAEAALLL